MTRVSRPSILPPLNGDLLKRANLLRFIREFIQFSSGQSRPEWRLADAQSCLRAFDEGARLR